MPKLGSKIDNKELSENYHAKYMREYRKKNPERRKKELDNAKDYYHNVRKKQNYEKLYGISEEIYNKMFEDQNGCCAICKINRSELKKDLFVDHCHITKNVRGLLCSACNLGLGSFRDNIDNLKIAIDYLNQP